jgi:hypothetical protein
LGVNRRIGEKRIEFDVVVGDIEAWVVKNVESLNVVPQIETVTDFEILKNGKVPSGLEGPPKYITSTHRVARLIEIANLAGTGALTGWNAVCAGSKWSRYSKGCRV